MNKDHTFKTADRYIRAGKVLAAIDEYEKWVAANPKDINTIFQIGDLYHRIGRNAEAVEKYSQIAEQLRLEGFRLRALAVYNMILRVEPENEAAIANLAELQVALDRRFISTVKLVYPRAGTSA